MAHSFDEFSPWWLAPRQRYDREHDREKLFILWQPGRGRREELRTRIPFEVIPPVTHLQAGPPLSSTCSSELTSRWIY